MRKTLNVGVGAVLMVLAGASVGQQDLAGGAGVRLEAFGHGDLSPRAVEKAALIPWSQRLGVRVGDVPIALCPAVDVDGALVADSNQPPEVKVLRYGLGVDVLAALTEGTWIKLDKEAGGGALWVIDVVSLGAIGLRVHLNDLNLPEGSSIVAYSPDDPANVVGPIERNGPSCDGSHWTATRPGERLRIEFFVPEKVELPANPFIIDGVQHIYRNPVQADEAREEALRGAGACHNDVSCFSAWANTAKAVAGIGTVNQNSLYCSGTMLATTAADQTPYYLTANHCLSTSSAANSAEIYWLYQSSSCGGAVPGLSTVPQSAPCTLLSTGATPDYTLLMIEGSIPRTSLFWAGWTGNAVADATASTCIHHPGGSYKRISFGTKASNPTCSATQHIRVNWTDGPTEPGSSGSGIFLDSTQQLYGQLTCGPSACGSETNDSYGYMNSYIASISSLLAAGSDDALEGNDSCAMARAMTAGTSTGLIVKSTDEDWYKVTLTPGQTLTCTATFTHANGDIDLQAFTTCGGAAVASSTGSTGTETLNYASAAGGDVFVRIYLAGDTRNTYSMTLSVVGGGPTDDSLEENDSCASARTLTAGNNTGLIVKSTDEDWYAVSLTTGQTLTATWSFTHATADLDVAAYTTCGGALVASSTSTTDSEVITFAATGTTTVYLRTYLFSGTQNTYSLNIAIANPAATLLLMTFNDAVSTIPGLGTVQNEDIVAYNTTTGAWSLVFDGSDIGLSLLAIDALTVNASDEFIVSFTADSTVASLLGGPNGTTIDDADLARFTPTTLGSTTSGTLNFHFDGSDVGLDETVGGEDVDAVALMPSGDLLISTTGTNNVLGVNTLDEDLLQFTATSLGATTAGTWTMYFDGSDVDLSTTADEDIDAADMTPSGTLYLSTVGLFAVTGVSGDDHDIFQFSPTTTGPTTTGTYSLVLGLNSLGIDATEDLASIAVTLNPLNGTNYAVAAPPAGPACIADWTGDLVVDSDDLNQYLNDFFMGDANFNSVEGTDSQDLLEFVEAFFMGC